MNTKDIGSALLCAPRASFAEGKRYYVYALFKHGKPVYVGSTINVLPRMGQHRNRGIDFDEYSFVEVSSQAEAHELETRAIGSLNTPLNKGFSNTPASGFASASTIKLRHGVGKVALRKLLLRHDIDHIIFKGSGYYKVAQVLEAIATEAA